jgi:hypothetical protein
LRVIFIVTVLLGIGVGLFTPLPFLGVTPLPQEPGLPTFDQTAERIGEPEITPPPTGQNPERRKLRKAVLHAAGQLEVNPCDKRLRKKFVAAIRPFAQSIQNGPREVAIVNGKERDVSKRYDRPATDAIFAALMRGHITPRDLAGPWGGFLKMSAAPAGMMSKPDCFE